MSNIFSENFRLQLLTHDEVFETREKAVDYINDYFKPEALKSEPACVYYGNASSPELLIAVGTGNRRVYLIDFTKLQNEVTDINEIVKDSSNMISSMESSVEDIVNAVGLTFDDNKIKDKITYEPDAKDVLISDAKDISEAIDILSKYVQKETITVDKTESVSLTKNNGVVKADVRISEVGNDDAHDFNDNIVGVKPDGLYASAFLDYDNETKNLTFITSGFDSNGVFKNDAYKKVFNLGNHTDIKPNNKVNSPVVLTIKDTDEFTKEISAKLKLSEDSNNILELQDGNLLVNGRANNISYKDQTVASALNELNKRADALERDVVVDVTDTDSVDMTLNKDVNGTTFIKSDVKLSNNHSINIKDGGLNANIDFEVNTALNKLVVHIGDNVKELSLPGIDIIDKVYYDKVQNILTLTFKNGTTTDIKLGDFFKFYRFLGEGKTVELHEHENEDGSHTVYAELKLRPEDNALSVNEKGELYVSINELTTGLSGDVEKLKTDLLQEINNRTAADTAETSAREAAIKDLQNQLDTESNRSKEVDNTLTTTVEALTSSLNSEIERSTKTDESLRTDLNAEVADRKLADTELLNKIDNEINRSTTLDNTLTTTVEALTSSLNSEIDRSAKADESLRTDLTAEVADRKLADTELLNKIDNEINRSTTLDNTLTTAVETLTTNLNSEIDRSAKADESLRTDLTAEVASRELAETNLLNKINNEIERSTNIDNTLTTAVDTITANLNVEIERSKKEEQSIKDALETEKDVRELTDTVLSTRISAIEEKDVAFTESINQNATEIAKLKEADNTINLGLLEVQKTLENEITRAQASENVLTETLNTVSGNVANNTSNISNNSTLIQALRNDLTTEETRATNAETNLNTRIDNVKSLAEVNQTNITKLADRVSTNESSISGLNSSIDAINTSLGNIDTNASNLATELSKKIETVELEEVTKGNYLLKVDGKDVGSINVPLDKLLTSASYNHETNILSLIFNTEGDAETALNVSLKELVDVYEAGNGLKLESIEGKSVFSVFKNQVADEGYLNIDENGISVTGIKQTLDASKQGVEDNRNLINYLRTEMDSHNKTIPDLSDKLNSLTDTLSSEISKVNNDINTVNTNLQDKSKEFAAFDKELNDRLIVAEGNIANNSTNIAKVGEDLTKHSDENKKSFENVNEKIATLNAKQSALEATTVSQADAIAANSKSITDNVKQINVNLVELTTKIDNEITRATEREAQIEGTVNDNSLRIDNEKARALGEERRIETIVNVIKDTTIPEVNNSISNLNTNITTELGKLQNEDLAIKDRLVTVESFKEKIDSNQANIAALQGKAIELHEKDVEIENNLQSVDTKLTKAIEDEVRRATASEESHVEKVNNQIANAVHLLEDSIKDVSTELNATIALETSARESADTALEGKLNNNIALETSAREAADTALEGKISESNTKIEEHTSKLTNIDSRLTNLESNELATADALNTVETNLTDLINTEKQRATDVESNIIVTRIPEAIQTSKTYTDTEIAKIKNDVNGNTGNLNDVSTELASVKTLAESKVGSVELKPSETLNGVYYLMVDGFMKGEINIPADQIMESARYDRDLNALILVFKTGNTTNEVTVPMNELIDVYKAGNGLALDDTTNTFSVKVNEVATENYLSVDSSGLCVRGIDAALNAQATNTQTLIDGVEAKVDANKLATDDAIAALAAQVEENKNNILTNTSQLTILNGDEAQDGSVKHSVNLLKLDLDSKITTEKERAMQVEDSIADKVNDNKDEIAQIHTDIIGINNSIDNEIKDRKTEDDKLKALIDSNSSLFNDKLTTTNDKLTQEIADRKDADKANSDKISQEITDRGAAVKDVSDKLTQEITERKTDKERIEGSIQTLSTNADKLSGTVSTISDKLEKEIEDRKAGVLEAKTLTNTIKGELQNSINQEVSDRKEADKAIRESITANTTALTQEITNREYAVNEVKNSVSTLNNSLTNVKTIADKNTASISTESQRAITAEATLRTDISNALNAVSQETTRAQAAEEGLTTTVETFKSSLENEMNNIRSTANSLSGRIDTNVSNIAANTNKINTLETSLAKSKFNTKSTQSITLSLTTGADEINELTGNVNNSGASGNIIKIVGDGIYAKTDVSYNEATNTLSFDNGIKQSTWQLKQVTAIKSVRFDPDTKKLIFTVSTVDGDKDIDQIDVTEFFKGVNVNNDNNTVNLSVNSDEDGVQIISGNVKIADRTDNLLVNQNGTLFASKNAEDLLVRDDTGANVSLQTTIANLLKETSKISLNTAEINNLKESVQEVKGDLTNNVNDVRSLTSKVEELELKVNNFETKLTDMETIYLPLNTAVNLLSQHVNQLIDYVGMNNIENKPIVNRVTDLEVEMDNLIDFGTYTAPAE